MRDPDMPVPLEPPRPAKRPQYGHDPNGDLNRFEDEDEEYYDEEEDLDVDEAIAELEEYAEGTPPSSASPSAGPCIQVTRRESRN